jgi:hypothetical protein
MCIGGSLGLTRVASENWTEAARRSEQAPVILGARPAGEQMGHDAGVAVTGLVSGVGQDQLDVDVQDIHCLGATDITGIGPKEPFQCR